MHPLFLGVYVVAQLAPIHRPRESEAMALFSDRSKDAYERAVAAAEIDPRNLTSDQKEMLRKASRQTGALGNRARKALGQ